MSILDYMPSRLEQCRDEVPYEIQVGYAMWAVRSVLGGHVVRTPVEISRDADGHIRVVRWAQRHYESVEEHALANIILENTPPEPIQLYDQRLEEEHDQPRIKQHFLQSVDYVLQYLSDDGTCRVRNKRGELQWTGNPHKIAAELDVFPAHVRAAQAQLEKRKAG